MSKALSTDTKIPSSFSIEEDEELLCIYMMGSFTKEQYFQALDKVCSKIQQPGKKWVVLTDYKQFQIKSSMGIHSRLAEFTRSNTPFIERSAFIGLTGVRGFIFDTIVKMGGRSDNTRRFDNKADAIRWLRNLNA